jgi:hypothetical protein
MYPIFLAFAKLYILSSGTIPTRPTSFSFGEVGHWSFSTSLDLRYFFMIPSLVLALIYFDCSSYFSRVKSFPFISGFGESRFLKPFSIVDLEILNYVGSFLFLFKSFFCIFFIRWLMNSSFFSSWSTNVVVVNDYLDLDEDLLLVKSTLFDPYLLFFWNMKLISISSDYTLLIWAIGRGLSVGSSL